jgi:hypothetical protein
MWHRLMLGVALAGVALGPAAHAKKPAATEEAALRGMIERLYKPYTEPLPAPPEDGSYAPDNAAGAGLDGYEIPKTATLGALIDRWDSLMARAEEVYILNDFDWYCQCQDNDNRTAKIMTQTYNYGGKNQIDAKIVFSPGRSEQGDSGLPLIFRFKREGGAWKLDDLKFSDGQTLRKDLAQDIKDATRDLAKKKPE